MSVLIIIAIISLSVLIFYLIKMDKKLSEDFEKNKIIKPRILYGREGNDDEPDVDNYSEIISIKPKIRIIKESEYQDSEFDDYKRKKYQFRFNKEPEQYQVPVFPEFTNKVVIEKSESEIDVTYAVNIYEAICTCKNFFEMRKDLPKNIIPRYCKHLKTRIIKINKELELSPLFYEFIRNKYNYDFYTSFIAQGSKQTGKEIGLAFSKTSEWISVFAPYFNKYQRYSFSLVEDRWSHNEIPQAAVEIKENIFKYFTIYN